jgi:hypothetical protein
MTSMAAPTLVLVAGFARAGKDTLASGILEWSTRPSRKQNFADYLKDASNDFLMSLNLPGDFHQEAFKVQHRDFLVAAGRLARSIDVDIFAKNLANFCPIQMTPDQLAPETVVCSDWRYSNELEVCQDVLLDLGWKVRTIYVSTAGIGPANPEELDSIAEIRERHSFDLELTFAPNSRNTIMQEGRYIAKTWRL